MKNEKIEAAIEDRASRDGAFAVAYAITRLADAQLETAQALRKLGLNDATTRMGAVELLAREASRIADALGSAPWPQD
ncbi:hypothetical protein [Azospirillum sp. B510]|uniref:hypothetical protein n=1 Tax=Azospirillum sp. (strain B510) TaxID=137722 RepID=UPI0002E3BFB8|nr:hypothetical protein [Azospirillum sp. B510]